MSRRKEAVASYLWSLCGWCVYWFFKAFRRANY